MTHEIETSVGTFRIAPDGNGWRLWIENERLGWYATAEMAAQDVSEGSSGCVEWDALVFERLYRQSQQIRKASTSVNRQPHGR